TAGADYTSRTGTLSFAAGVTSQSFTVPILEDATGEANETINLALSAPTGGATLRTPSSAVVTITDNDASFPTLPGRLQAEDFRNGASGTAYFDTTAGNTGNVYRTTDVDIQASTDTGAGYNIGWTAATEWLAYDVTVTQAGAYDFAARVASGSAGTKTLRFDVDGVAVATLNFTDATGWQAWTTVVARNINLTAGNHVVRVNMVTGGFNLNWWEVTAAAANQAPIAQAGPDQTAIASRVVTLDGSASRDPDNGPQALTYQWTQTSGTTVTLTNATTARPTFTPSSAGVYQFQLQARDGSLTSTDSVSVTVVSDPALAGPRTSTRTVYAAANLNYGYLATPPIFYSGEFGEQIQAQGDYLDYHLKPTGSYSTRTLDMGVFDCAGSDLFPPIATDSSNVPINGIFYRPSGTGPFPIAFFVHGSHAPVERSEPGYEEAAAHLASHGVLAVSIDENYLNAACGNGARAVMLLEHIKQFRTWNTTSGHPLFGQIDMNRIMLIGHSRGGEGVEHASFFNQLTKNGVTTIRPYPNTPTYAGFNDPVSVNGTGQFGPWQFNLQSVVAVAPTEGQYQPVDPNDQTRMIPTVVRDNFFMIYGSRDADVSQFVGHQAYDRAIPFTVTAPVDNVSSYKGLLYLFNANHNYFNRIWSQRPDGSGRCLHTTCYNPAFQLSKNDQYNAFKTWLATLSQGFVLNRPEYLDVLREKPLLAAVLPRAVRTDDNTALTLGFNSQFQDRYRRIFNHYEEDTSLPTVSPLPTGFSGGNEVLGLTASEGTLNWTQNQYLIQETRGLKVVWGASGTRTYRTWFNDGLPLTTSGGQALTHVALRIGFTPEETTNPVSVNQDFTLEVRDFGGRSHAIAGSALFGTVPVLPYANSYSTTERGSKPYVVVMQTVRFPLALFAERGITVNDIAEVRLRFDRTAAGSVYLDDVQLTR
ncbi:MAG TPA: carbohydrate-binding domain-containing protein, partial [Polyangia bacterium]